MNENELMHYGRKGMKWYQHIFGEIDKRAAYATAKLKATAEKQRKMVEAERSLANDRKLASNKKALRTLSDEEIRSRINRLQLEKQYRDLVLGDKSKQTTNRGRDITLSIVKSFGTTAAAQYGTAYGKYKGEKDTKAWTEKQAEDKKRAEAKREAKESRAEEKRVNKATNISSPTIGDRANKTIDDISNGVSEYLFLKKNKWVV